MTTDRRGEWGNGVVAELRADIAKAKALISGSLDPNTRASWGRYIERREWVLEIVLEALRASRPSPAERDREDAVDLACLTLNAAYRCLVFRERQSNFHPTESLGAIAAYLQACLRGGDSLEAAEARYCHPKMHDAASRVSGASDA